MNDLTQPEGKMKKYILAFLGSMITIAVLIWFGGRWILSFSKADYSGEISVTGIGQKTEITFDEKGIPQIWAENDHDLYFALGWLHASERLFQMEFLRMLTYGELSATFGESAYETDVFQRKLGFIRKAKKDIQTTDPQILNLLQSYCDGINSWIESKSILPPEFWVLKLEPRPWKPLDCLGIVHYQTWYAHALMDVDYQYNHLIETFGPELVNILKKHKTWSPPTVHNSFLKTLFANNRFPLLMSRASNSWVVAPTKSASGAAIHASDPHLPINMVPGFWYIAGLHATIGTSVLGITAPGLPLVMMGHNQDIAFAFTVAGVDLVDYFHEKKNPLDSMQVLTPNGFQDMTVIREEIKIKDRAEPVIEEIWMTPHGVVVENHLNYVLTLRWAGFDFDIGKILESAFNLQRASDFQTFREAVTGLGALNVNWTYSDARGNIGYQLGSPIPRRKIENTFVELVAEDSLTHWQGYYELPVTPSLLNPEEGWLASCNNQIVSEKWPYEIPGIYDPYRITRASALLSEKNRYSREDFEKMQADHISGIALRWKHLLIQSAEKMNLNDIASQLKNWDGAMEKESYVAALFRFWWEHLNFALFEDDFGDDWQAGGIIKEAVISHEYQPVIDNRATVNIRENLLDVSNFALHVSLQKLGQRTYGEINQLVIRHPLSRAKILNAWLNLDRGPLSIEGDHGSLGVNQARYNREQNQFNTLAGASMRFILDWADVDGFTIHTNLGQSGNPLSEHYDDFLELWQQGGRWVVPFNKEVVFEKKNNLLTLTPKND
jgi:penicillin amidase